MRSCRARRSAETRRSMASNWPATLFSSVELQSASVPISSAPRTASSSAVRSASSVSGESSIGRWPGPRGRRPEERMPAGR